LFQTTAVEKIKTRILYSITFSPESFCYELTWKNFVEPYRPRQTLRMCNTCCIFTATVVTRTRLFVTL